MTRNSGQSAAMLRGLSAARHDIVVTLDGDLQNDPADIPALAAKVGEFDVVCGYRAKRRDTWSRRIGSRLANRIRNSVTRDGMRDTGSASRRSGANAWPTCRGWTVCTASCPPISA